jgi:hypothetical protein
MTEQLISKKPKTVNRVLLIISIVAMILSVVLFYLYKQEKSNTPGNELNKILGKISKIMDLPDEVPQMAKVTDQEVFKEQGFFSQAINDDVVLVYVRSQKAILYRPSEKKVIDIAVIRPVDDQQQGEVIIEAIEASTTVTLYNGSSLNGVTQQVEDKLLNANINIVVNSRDKASLDNYQETLVIDLVGTKGDKARQAAEVLGAKTGQLPTGEEKPATDLLVIVANDFSN